MGMRFAVPSGGSHKLTIPKSIVEEKWQRVTNEMIAVCFIYMDGKVCIEDIERLLRNNEYAPSVVLEAKNSWLEYAWRLKIKKERVLEEGFINGRITEPYYRQQLRKNDELFRKISEKMRRALTLRGIHFSSLNDLDDFREVESVITEKEKDEDMLTMLDTIRGLAENKKSVTNLLEKLGESRKTKGVSKSVFKILKSKYQKELKSVDWRIEKIKDYIATQLC